MVTLESLRDQKPAIDRLATRYGARSVQVFGSVARGSAHSNSDVDLLIDFDTDRTLFDLIGLRLGLSDLLGVEVDIVTPDSLRYIRDRVLAQARPIVPFVRYSGLEKNMFAPAVDYDKDQIDQAIRAVEKKFPDDIERIAYSVGDDWADEPALFFQVLVKDRGGSPSDLRQSSRLPEVLSVSRAVMADLGDAVRAYRIQPYFSFRLVSEQERLRDPRWN